MTSLELCARVIELDRLYLAWDRAFARMLEAEWGTSAYRSRAAFTERQWRRYAALRDACPASLRAVRSRRLHP